MTDPPRSAPIHFDPIDQVYAGLRGAALVLGLAYVYLAKVGSGARDDALVAFGVFAAYGTVFYAVGLGALRTERGKARFYASLGAADLAFIVVLMYLTGAEASPFYRALYLWVAMPAFYFGLRAGTLASAVAFCVYVAFFDDNTQNPWEFLVRAGGLLLHGPVVGYLVARDRELRQRLARLEAENREKPSETR
ncbi:MAG: hypothetical protein OEZ06_26485 [Myxococcales bacterium]|nr:hypothetical protein [Myxococcales bacterium]